MSKNINVNPGQYKVAGRERQGQDIVAAKNKAKESIGARQSRQQARTQKGARGQRSKRGQ